MRELSIKEYAKLERISIYQMVKRLRKGELRSVEREENGKKVVKILLPEKQESEGEESVRVTDEKESYPKESDSVIAELIERIDRLEKLIQECCCEGSRERRRLSMRE